MIKVVKKSEPENKEILEEVKNENTSVGLTDDEVLDVADKMDEIRIIGVPRFCVKYNITQEQLNEVSKRAGVEIPKYRSLRKDQIEAAEKMMAEVKAMSVEQLKSINFIQLSNKYKINHSTVARIIKREIKNLDEIKKGKDTKIAKPVAKKATKKPHTGGRQTSDKTINAIKYSIEHPDMTKKNVAIKFGICPSTLTRAFRILEEKKKETAKKSAEAVAIDKDYIDANPNMEEVKRGNATMVEVKMDNYIVVAALMAERHEFPTEISIFNKKGFSTNELFNFRWQEEQVDKFIDEWIPFVDGKPAKKLGVYLSGCQMAYGSLVKVCERRKVNLDVFNYNTDMCQYVTQSIFDGFEMAMMKNEAIYNILTKSSKFGGLYTINCNFDKINHLTSELYMVRKLYYPNSASVSYNRVEYVIVHGLENCWTIFGRFIEEFREMNKSGKATITPIKLDDDDTVNPIKYERDVVSQKVNMLTNPRTPYTVKSIEQ